MKAAIARAWRNPHVQMHFCVLLWGFTAILGKLISLSAIPLVFWRVSIVSLCLFLWPPLWRQLARVTRRDLGLSLVVGVLVTLHWLTFYGAIKLANASVGVVCIALAPVFLSLAEPLLARQAIVRREVLLAAVSIVGVVLVVGGIPATMLAGFALGTLSAFLDALFVVVNKRLAVRVPALALTALELGAGVLLLGLLLPAWPLFGAAFAWPGEADLIRLLILALACTLLPFALSLVALRRLSAFTAQLAVNMEPVYAIAIAAVFLGESRELGWPFYLGVAVILGAILLHARLQRSAPSPAYSTGP